MPVDPDLVAAALADGNPEQPDPVAHAVALALAADDARDAFHAASNAWWAAERALDWRDPNPDQWDRYADLLRAARADRAARPEHA